MDTVTGSRPGDAISPTTSGTGAPVVVDLATSSVRDLNAALHAN